MVSTWTHQEPRRGQALPSLRKLHFYCHSTHIFLSVKIHFSQNNLFKQLREKEDLQPESEKEPAALIVLTVAPKFLMCIERKG